MGQGWAGRRAPSGGGASGTAGCAAPGGADAGSRASDRPRPVQWSAAIARISSAATPCEAVPKCSRAPATDSPASTDRARVSATGGRPGRRGFEAGGDGGGHREPKPRRPRWGRRGSGRGGEVGGQAFADGEAPSGRAEEEDRPGGEEGGEGAHVKTLGMRERRGARGGRQTQAR